MASSYLIDGYNLIYALGLLHSKVGPQGLEKSRSDLLGLVAGSLAAEAGNVTVVFDAAHAPPGARHEENVRGIRVLYSPAGEEADDLIETLLAQHSSAKHVTVVSNDHRVQQAARRRQAQAMPCEEFADLLMTHRKPASAPLQAPEKRDKLSPEETQRWLKEFGDLEDDPAMKEWSALRPWPGAERDKK